MQTLKIFFIITTVVIALGQSLRTVHKKKFLETGRLWGVLLLYLHIENTISAVHQNRQANKLVGFLCNKIFKCVLIVQFILEFHILEIPGKRGNGIEFDPGMIEFMGKGPGA